MELLTQTWANLTANKLRSFLTMFGIIWGVVSIVLLSGLGEGFQRGNQKVLEEHKGTLIVPEAAVIYDAERNAAVEVIADEAPGGRLRRSITTGLSTGTKTEVLKGLKEGERVILQ